MHVFISEYVNLCLLQYVNLYIVQVPTTIMKFQSNF